jgi:hypothetical protein
MLDSFVILCSSELHFHIHVEPLDHMSLSPLHLRTVQCFILALTTNMYVAALLLQHCFVNKYFPSSRSKFLYDPKIR